MSAPWDWREVPDVVAAVEAATISAANSAAGHGFGTPRAHLGASQIGVECERRLWWEFRHGGTAANNSFRGVRAAQRGGLMEKVFEEELRTAHLSPGEGGIYCALGGHFGGTADAVVTVPEKLEAEFGLAQGTKILIDYKDLNHRRFLELRRKGPRLFEDGRYWAQVQIYIHFARESGHLPGCEWGGFYCADKNEETRAFYLFPFSPDAAAVLVAKARRVISAPRPPPRMEEKPTALACRFCPALDWCWDTAPLARNCRTCCHFAPQMVENELFFMVQRTARHLIPPPAWSCELDRPWHLGPCAAHHAADAPES